MLDHVDGARARAVAGDLAFGTVDTFLLWRLTGGRVHATDASNASRTALFNIHKQCWDATLLRYFDVPEAILPQVLDTADHFGTTDPEVLGTSIRVGALVGDQQAALVGQGCLQPGMLKSTYGTGCFAMLNTGGKAHESRHRLLTTVAYRLNGKNYLRPRGLDLHGGRECPVAERTPWVYLILPSRPQHSLPALNRTMAFTSYPPLRDWAHPTGIPMPEAPCWA